MDAEDAETSTAWSPDGRGAVEVLFFGGNVLFNFWERIPRGGAK